MRSGAEGAGVTGITLRNYQREAPKGGETTRERFVAALARAGLPAG